VIKLSCNQGTVKTVTSTSATSMVSPLSKLEYVAIVAGHPWPRPDSLHGESRQGSPCKPPDIGVALRARANCNHFRKRHGSRRRADEECRADSACAPRQHPPQRRNRREGYATQSSAAENRKSTSTPPAFGKTRPKVSEHSEALRPPRCRERGPTQTLDLLSGPQGGTECTRTVRHCRVRRLFSLQSLTGPIRSCGQG
jgi:hypothetical protein